MPGRDLDPISEARRQWLDRGWGDAADGMTAVTTLMRAHQLVLARCDAALVPFGLTFARYELLALVSFTRKGEIPLGKAGARLQVHPASITNAVRRLEEQGLVRRDPNPNDGRGVLARITPAGREVAEEATAALNRVFTDLGLDQPDARRLTGLLGKVRERAGDTVT